MAYLSKHSLPRANRQSGVTLVEIMVGIVISLILLNGVIQIFISSKQTYRFGEAVSRLQESGRFAMELLTGDLRMAGYQGCADLGSIPANVIANNPPVVSFSSEVVKGWEIDATMAATPSSPALPTGLTNMISNSDVVSIQHASDTGVKLTGNMLVDNANIQLQPTSLFKANDVLFISDCETVDVFRANNVSNSGTITTIAHSNSVNTTNKLSKPYGTDASVYAFESNVYYVGNTGRTNGYGNPIMALYKRDVNGVVTELVEGVENIQVLYGERADNGNMRYVKANDATLDMNKVISVRIGLLISSIQEVNRDVDNNTYNVAGTTIGTSGTVTHPADKRIRRVFIATVRLRNRR